jgi:hypothetical protein
MRMNRTHLPLGCLLALFASAWCQAAPDSNFANARIRDIAGGRKVLIIVTQSAIEPRILPTPNYPRPPFVGHRAGPATITRLELERQQQLMLTAAQDIVPLLQGLAGYDFNTPLQAVLRPAVEKSIWLHAQDIEFSEHGTLYFVLDKLNESDTRQMLLLYTNYYTNPDFSAIVVEHTISLLVRKIPPGKRSADRLKPKYIPYQQVIRTIVTLPSPDWKDHGKNVERWAADHGKLARHALDAGIATLAALVPVSLELTEASAKDWRSRGDRKTEEIEGMLGWVRERDENGLLLIGARNGEWTRIQTAR